MDVNRFLVSIILKWHPEAADAIWPHGPAIADELDLVALNPQPLPPVDAGIRFGRMLTQLDFAADKVGRPVKPLADWSTIDGHELDDLGRPNPVLAALLAWLTAGGRLPVPDDEPRPHWKSELLAGVVIGLVASGNALDSSAFLQDAFETAIAGIGEPADVRRTTAA